MFVCSRLGRSQSLQIPNLNLGDDAPSFTVFMQFARIITKTYYSGKRTTKGSRLSFSRPICFKPMGRLTHLRSVQQFVIVPFLIPFLFVEFSVAIFSVFFSVVIFLLSPLSSHLVYSVTCAFIKA